MLEICIQASYDQNIQLILKSYLPVVYGTPLRTYTGWLSKLALVYKDPVKRVVLIVQRGHYPHNHFIEWNLLMI